MTKPFINEQEFLKLGCEPIDTPAALSQAIHTLRPGMELTKGGAEKLYRDIQMAFFADRLANNGWQSNREEEKRVEEIMGWLNNGFPTFRYGHAGNWFIPTHDSSISNRPLFSNDSIWENADNLTERDRELAHFQYEALLKEGAFSNPIMLIQINWSGNGWSDNAPFWLNVLAHRGADNSNVFAGQLPKMWAAIQDEGFDSTIQGAYLTDFYKPFSTPDSGSFYRTLKKVTLETFLDTDSAKLGEWRSQISATPFSVKDFNVLDSAVDFTGATDFTLPVLGIVQMAMLIQLCHEAELLHVDHPIMVPWGNLPAEGLKASVPLAMSSSTFPYSDELPFLDGGEPSEVFNSTKLQHNSRTNVHMGGWLESTEFTDCMNAIAKLKADWGV
ncbi:hypothetical protein BAAM0483_08090 [Bifidobacterium animalis subsp. animalis MCC 0483]|uniref:Uncharacterized protein n=1 Tax=Bifidobacterium animalis subsp. animalis MCC 0483 TaxID=1365955 RepID=A0AB34T7J8_9BIFI|nr:hypothetical protein [Bifidobacterium animalis]KOA48435.1 hypothetical protein BAAM0483_08090 [Bifidobacterium animalis subsp. animalis MCC 0483]